jgi:hypothetical protein
VPSDCVYDVWGADYGVEAGATCLNSDPAHQAAYHGGPETDDGEWLRKGKSKWTPASWPNDSGRTFDGLLECAPLEECPDPRAAS